MNNIGNTPPPLKKPIGCGLLIATFISSTFIVLAAFFDYFLNWIIEQSLFESSMAMPDFRWINHAICIGIILLVSVIMSFAVKQPQIRIVFRLWLIAAIWGALAIPAKTLFLTAQNETTIFQIGTMILLFTGSMALKKKEDRQNTSHNNTHFHISGLVAVLGALICVPWVLWGSLGSGFDTILVILFGLFFAWSVVRFVFPYYLDKVQTNGEETKFSKLLFHGFVIAVFLLIVVVSITTNGSGQMLILTVPVSGWLMALLSAIAKDKPHHGRWNAGLVLMLLVSLPLLFFDMDELSALFTGSQGETLEWATKSAWFTFLGLIMVSGLLFSALRGSKLFTIPRKANFGLIVISVIATIGIYFFWGQAGFHGDKIFIILKEQADLSNYDSITDSNVRRQGVYDKLVETAKASQEPVITQLEKMNLEYTPYYLLNAIEVRGNLITKLILKNNPAVDRILDSPILRPLPEPVPTSSGEFDSLDEAQLWNITMIQADKIEAEFGIDGSGIVIGQTDSGVDGRHPELAKSYRGADTEDDYNWYDPWNQTPFPTDHGGHGTGTLSVAMGVNTGVAPGAQWIGCVNLDRNLGNPARYLDCMQFMLAPFPQGGDSFEEGNPQVGAMIVNNSWGCPDVEGCDSQVYEPVVSALKTAGIFMAVSAGNSGNYGCSTVTDPAAIYADVFTVGSVDWEGNLSSFSSIGPVLVDGSGRQKPELVAPGENVMAAFPGGTYTLISGTSFSAPHVTGVVALMWSANPKLIGNIEATTEILRSTAANYSGSSPSCGTTNEAVGSGVLDAFRAVEAAIAYE